MALNTLGSNRDQLLGLAAADRERLIAQEVLVGDPRRWRPRWFNGRFLAASDLQSEQNYFLIRQADLGRAGGRGVIDGLMVSETLDPASGADLLRIEPGQGVTDTGELVVLFRPLTLNPADVPEMQRLDAAFGLQVIPNEPGTTRTGLYVLTLRPVEWTANPISAYPTSLTGTRTVEDGTVVEGVAVSLIPYPDNNNDESWDRRRARVAREIFVDGRDRGLSSGVLPLAMVALRGNLVEWVDPFLVRRETGAERPAGMDFGFGARALREAHLLQYQRHLADALDARKDQPFLATAYLDALPAVGPFPSATLDPANLTQRFFPSGIEVELSFLPEDELAAVIEESLLLPPIDLTVDPTGTGVIVLIPLSRADFASKRSVLPNWDAELPRLRPASKLIRAAATPKQLLQARFFNVALPEPVAEEEPWRQTLRDALRQPLLWYVRRRHLPIPSNVAGTPVAADSVSVRDPRMFLDALSQDRVLATRLGALSNLGVPEVNALTSRLTERRFVDNPALLRSLVLKATEPSVSVSAGEAAVTALAPVSDPALGAGLARLARQSSGLSRTLNTKRVSDTGTLVGIDRLARDVPAAKFADFAKELESAVQPGTDIAEKLPELRSRFVG